MNTNVYIAVVILVCAVCTFSERLFPFLIFGKHKVPRVVRYLGISNIIFKTLLSANMALVRRW